MEVEKLTAEEIQDAVSKMQELVEEAATSFDEKTVQNMYTILNDARDNFVWRVNYPKLTKQCWNCKYCMDDLPTYWHCGLGKETVIGCEFFEEKKETDVVPVSTSEIFAITADDYAVSATSTVHVSTVRTVRTEIDKS